MQVLAKDFPQWLDAVLWMRLLLCACSEFVEPATVTKADGATPTLPINQLARALDELLYSAPPCLTWAAVESHIRATHGGKTTPMGLLAAQNTALNELRIAFLLGSTVSALIYAFVTLEELLSFCAARFSDGCQDVMNSVIGVKVHFDVRFAYRTPSINLAIVCVCEMRKCPPFGTCVMCVLFPF